MRTDSHLCIVFIRCLRRFDLQEAALRLLQPVIHAVILRFLLHADRYQLSPCFHFFLPSCTVSWRTVCSPWSILRPCNPLAMSPPPTFRLGSGHSPPRQSACLCLTSIHLAVQSLLASSDATEQHHACLCSSLSRLTCFLPRDMPHDSFLYFFEPADPGHRFRFSETGGDRGRRFTLCVTILKQTNWYKPRVPVFPYRFRCTLQVSYWPKGP
ncbi:hypothetical protein F5I97DRAFT_138114 [Phlebopus sp. FC_14]|nr:hypothetical protein F5I97DRAFT_138114 [Phlebopus sp. FC_14]